MTAFISSDTYIRPLLLQELQRDEGVKNTVYTDSRGFLTVGMGHNLSIPQSQFTIDALAQDDMNGAEAALDAAWPWWRSLDAVRQRVMLNMMFNLGTSKLAGFTKFLAAMQAGQWQTAAAEMKNSAWWSQVGPRAVRLQYMVINDLVMPGTV